MFPLFRRPASPAGPARPRRLAFDRLEDRTAPALGVGPAFIVNGIPGGADASAVAGNRAGQSVVAWVQEAGGFQQLRAQRFDAAGGQLGGELVVAAGAVGAPDVALDDAGNFVVVWAQTRSGSGVDVLAQRFTAAGARRGATFAVAARASTEFNPHVASDAAGNFIVTYQTRFLRSTAAGRQAAGDLYGVSYRSDGAIFKPFVIAGGQAGRFVADADIARTPDGRFAVAFSYTRDTSFTQDENTSGDVYVKSYTAAAAVRRTETIFTAVRGTYPVAVAIDDRSNPTVAWTRAVITFFPTTGTTEAVSAGTFVARVNPTGGRTGAIGVNDGREGILHDLAVDRTTGLVVVAWGFQATRGTVSSDNTATVFVTEIPLTNRPTAAVRAGGPDASDPATPLAFSAALGSRNSGGFQVTFTIARGNALDIVSRFGTY